MRPEARARVAALPAGARVLDVGGWASPLPRADAVLDLLPHATRGLYPHAGGVGGVVAPERFDAAGWTQLDVCDRAPWPYADDAFDVAVCSHTLEDLRDPVGVCAELSRVARAGYVEVPAPVEELTYGLQGPWVGWSHHRWVCEAVGLAPGTSGARVAGEGAPSSPAGAPAPQDGTPRPGLRFTHKPHLLAAPGRHLPAGTADGLAPADRVLAMWWEGELPAEEVVHVEGPSLDAWLAGLLEAAPARPVASAGSAPPRRRRRRPWRR